MSGFFWISTGSAGTVRGVEELLELAGVAVLTVDGVVGRGVRVDVVERDGRLFDRRSGVEIDYVSVVVFVPVAA